jgi:hypothetical protein
MRRIASLTAAVGSLAAILLASPTPGVAQDGTPVEGAWVVTSWVSPDGTTNDEPQPGLFVFTKTHYTMMFALGVESRARYEGEQLTDAEMVTAYGTFVANSGRYEVSGNELTTRAYVAKDPNYMGDWPENVQTYTFEIDEEGMLHLTFGADFGTLGGPTAILRQVDDQPAPF